MLLVDISASSGDAGCNNDSLDHWITPVVSNGKAFKGWSRHRRSSGGANFADILPFSGYASQAIPKNLQPICLFLGWPLSHSPGSDSGAPCVFGGHRKQSWTSSPLLSHEKK